MKIVKLCFLIFIALFGFKNVEAQTITNNTNCNYEVKAFRVPISQCGPLNVGVVNVVYGKTFLVLPPPATGRWNAAFGVRKLPSGIRKIIRHASCGTPQVKAVGFCDGKLIKAHYFSNGDLEID